MHPQSEGEPTDPISVDILDENHSSRGIDSFSNTSHNTQQNNSWPSRCGSTSGSQDSNKDSGTGTECFGGPPSNVDEEERLGSCQTLTGSGASPPSHMAQSRSSPVCSDSSGRRPVESQLPKSTSVSGRYQKPPHCSSNYHHQNPTLQGKHQAAAGYFNNRDKNYDQGKTAASQNSGKRSSKPATSIALTSNPCCHGDDGSAPCHKYGAVIQKGGEKVKESCFGANHDCSREVHSQGNLLPQDVVAQEHSSTSLPLLGNQQKFSRTGVS